MPGRTQRTRRVCVLVHRWCGLAMTVFLVVVGLTGSLLAFNTELERVCAPQLFAPARPGQPRLDLATLAERAQALVPRGRVQSVSLTEPDQISVWFVPRTDPSTGRDHELGFTEFFVDPWSGAELGRRNRGDLSQGLVNLMPFVYELHWTLAAGSVGQWVLGVVALIWTLDCVVGWYLTLPISWSSFWRRWRPAWLVKRGASGYRLQFDLHRAGGLWLWPLLFVFAWSSVMMNIRPVYEAVMQSFFDYRSPMDSLAPSAPRNDAPRLSWQEAQVVGERLLAKQSSRLGFTFGERLGLMYLPDGGIYLYEVRGSRDVFERAPKGGGTYVAFDGDTGAIREISQPTGEHTGNTVESWLYALHMARVFGMPYRVLVCLLGVATAGLAATGMYVWLRKRRARSTITAQSVTRTAASL